jgi:protoheme IX farnesyltransferase
MLKLIRFYIQLIKTPQTGLLLLTAIAGYRSTLNNDYSLIMVFSAMIGLLLVVSGTTAINMVFDHDIDAIMSRTKKRPLPSGNLSDFDATMFGIVLIAIGMAINLFISVIFAVVVFLGLFFDLVIYTFWLKRRSPLSIVFGGLSGGMPILAGRVLAVGTVDIPGILLALAILLWIPTHILTLAMNHSKDYKLAGVPTFPNVFGFKSAQYFIAMSNVIAGTILIFVFYLLNITNSGMVILILSTFLLIIFSVKVIVSPSKESNFAMFRYASIYMGIAMLILII